jgi:hypothetical protein
MHNLTGSCSLLKVKVKFTLQWAMNAQKESRCTSLSLTLVLGGDEWSMPCPSHFTPSKDPAHIVQDGWAPGSVSMCAENLASNGIQSLYWPACSESLHWLCYPGPCYWYENKYKLQFRCYFKEPLLSNWTVAVKGLNSNEGHNYSNPVTQNSMYDPILGQYVAVWYRSCSSHVVWDTIRYYDVDGQKLYKQFHHQYK